MKWDLPLLLDLFLCQEFIQKIPFMKTISIENTITAYTALTTASFSTLKWILVGQKSAKLHCTASVHTLHSIIYYLTLELIKRYYNSTLANNLIQCHCQGFREQDTNMVIFKSSWAALVNIEPQNAAS